MGKRTGEGGVNSKACRRGQRLNIEFLDCTAHCDDKRIRRRTATGSIQKKSLSGAFFPGLEHLQQKTINCLGFFPGFFKDAVGNALLQVAARGRG